MAQEFIPLQIPLTAFGVYPLTDSGQFRVSHFLGKNEKRAVHWMNQRTALPLAGFEAVNVLLHPVCALALHLACDVAVHVQREGRRGVAQVALNRLDIIPGTDSGHGVGMTEIVEPGVRQADGLDDPFKVVIERVR